MGDILMFYASYKLFAHDDSYKEPTKTFLILKKLSHVIFGTYLRASFVYFMIVRNLA